MGIKYLNYYLQQNCKQGIKKINLFELSHKKIVVDTSIYMYRFMGENALLDLSDRLPKVQKDLNSNKAKMNLKNFFDWFEEGNIYFTNLYKIFYQKKLVQKIKPFKSRKNPIIIKKFKSKYIDAKDAYDYLDPNFNIDPYYSVNKDISKLSSNIIYYGIKF